MCRGARRSWTGGSLTGSASCSCGETKSARTVARLMSQGRVGARWVNLDLDSGNVRLQADAFLVGGG